MVARRCEARIAPANDDSYGVELWKFVGAGSERLYELDLSVNPTNPTQTYLVLGDGTATIGSPSLDTTTDLLHVGSDAGILYAVQFPLAGALSLDEESQLELTTTEPDGVNQQE